jgi:hypothetical protein
MVLTFMINKHFFTWSPFASRELEIKIAQIVYSILTNSYAGKEGKEGDLLMCSSFLGNTIAAIDQEYRAKQN